MTTNSSGEKRLVPYCPECGARIPKDTWNGGRAHCVGLARWVIPGKGPQLPCNWSGYYPDYKEEYATPEDKESA